MSTFKRKYPAFFYPDFTYMWFGQIVSQAGNQMQTVALNWQIYILTHSAVALGLIGFIRFVPIVIFSLLGGSFADNFNRKTVQFTCQWGRGVLAIILAITTITHSITPLLIFILAAFDSAFVAFDSPARQAFVVNLIPRKIFSGAMGIWTTAYQTATIVGPTIGGFMIGRTGIASVYLLNIITFIVFIILLFQIKAKGNAHIKEGENSISVAHIVEGIQFIRSKTMIWSTTLLDFFSTFFSSATALLPIFANDVLKVGPQGLGLLYAAPAAGAVVAGIAFAHRGHIKNQGKVLLTAVAIYAFATVIFGISKSFPLSLIALFIVGTADSVSAIIRNIIRQLSTPDELRGRMSSITMIFFMGGPQLGDFEAGLVAGAIGGPLSVITGGLGNLIIIGLITAFVPTLRKYSVRQDEPIL